MLGGGLLPSREKQVCSSLLSKGRTVYSFFFWWLQFPLFYKVVTNSWSWVSMHMCLLNSRGSGFQPATFFSSNVFFPQHQEMEPEAQRCPVLRVSQNPDFSSLVQLDLQRIGQPPQNKACFDDRWGTAMAAGVYSYFSWSTLGLKVSSEFLMDVCCSQHDVQIASKCDHFWLFQARSRGWVLLLISLSNQENLFV